MNIPQGHQAVMPYLILSGAQQFLDFMTNVFNGILVSRHARDGDDSVIMHAEVNVSGSMIMFADSIPDYPPQPAGMFIYVDNADETFAKAKEHGAEVIQEPSDRDYGRTCGVKDPCGNVWWITSVSDQ